MNETDRLLLGELNGKMDLLIDLVKRQNSRIGELEEWRAAHEALHAAGQGENQVRRRIWDRVWQTVPPVIGAFAGYLVASWRRRGG